MILYFFLVFAYLLLELFKHQIDGGKKIGIAFGGDEIVLVLGGNQELDELVIILQIDHDFDLHDPLEKVQKLAGSFSNVILGFLIEMSMAGRDFYLHG